MKRPIALGYALLRRECGKIFSPDEIVGNDGEPLYQSAYLAARRVLAVMPVEFSFGRC